MALVAATIGAAILGGGATLLASNKAASASQHATDQSIALQQQQLAQTRQDEQPFVQAGYAATNALTSRLGLAGPGAGAVPTTASGQPSYSKFLAANPDIAAEAQRVVASGQFPSVGAYLQWHDANYGGEGRASYADPTQGAAAGATPTNALSTTTQNTPPQTATTNVLSGQPVMQTSQASPGPGALGRDTSHDPAATGAPASDGLTPPPPAAPGVAAPASNVAPSTAPGADPGTFGNGNPNFTNPGTFTPPSYTAPAGYQAPAYNEPGGFKYTAADYTASPAYSYVVDQSLKGALANSSATGALQSGATLKALQDRASNLAYQDFSNERQFAYGNYTDQRNFDRNNYVDDRNFGYNQSTDSRNFGYQNYLDSRNFGAAQFNTDRAFNYGAATDARNYLTSRYDTQTNNLFNLAGTGQSAASMTANAGQNSTNGIVNALNNGAATQGNAAIAGSNAISSLLGSGVNALAYSSARNGAAGTGAAANKYVDPTYAESF